MENYKKVLELFEGYTKEDAISELGSEIELIKECGESNFYFLDTLNLQEIEDILQQLINDKRINKNEVIKKLIRHRGFEVVSFENNKNKKDGEVTKTPILPLRGTKTSAGYDFYTPVDLIIKPQEKVFFWTDVKAYMNEGEVLLLDVRSSMGVKNDLMLSNTMPVIDSDYYNNEGNEGNIGISIRNLKPSIKFKGYETTYVGNYGQIDVPIIKDLTEENTVVIKAGDRVAQGFFVNYLPSDNCNSDEERKGGFGSSGK